MGSSSKGGGGSQSSLKNYYSSHGAIFSVGETDVITGIVVDGEDILFADINLATDPVPTYRDFPEREGRIWFYRGTDSQALSDPVLTKAGRDHSNSRYQLLLVFEDFLNGLERESVPDCSLIFQRGPKQSVITGNPVPLHLGQANGICSLAEMVENSVYGMGDSSIIHQASWQTVAEEIYSQRGSLYISPWIENGISFLEFVEKLAGYYDIVLRPNDSGQLVMSRYPQGVEAPVTMPTVTKDDIEPGTNPVINPVPIGKLPSRFELEWKDPALDFDTNQVRSEKRLIASKNSSTKAPLKYTRPWIQSGTAAQERVSKDGARDSTPYYEVTGLSVKESKGYDLNIGEPFLLALELNGKTESHICFPLSIVGFRDGSEYVQLECESARGYFISPEFEDFIDDTLEDDPEITAPSYRNVIHATETMAGDVQSLLYLCSKDTGILAGFEGYYRKESVEYQWMGSTQGFAVPLELKVSIANDGDYEDTSGNIKFSKVDSPTVFGFDEIPTLMTEDEYLSDSVWVIGISSTNLGQFEVMSLMEILSPVSDEYPFHLLRARQGTNRLSFVAGDRFWLIQKRNVSYFPHSSIADMAVEDDLADRTAYATILPYQYRETLDIADSEEFPFYAVKRVIDAPTGFRVEGILNGYALSFTVSEIGIRGVNVWVSDNPSFFPTEPTFVHALRISSRRDFSVSFTYTSSVFADVPKVRYFWIQPFAGDSLASKFSPIVGPIGSVSGTAAEGQRVIISADTQVFANSTFLDSVPETITLVCTAVGFVEPTYQWYFKDSAGTRIDLQGKIDATLDVDDTMSNTSGADLYRTYGCEVNEALYDEKTVWLAVSGLVAKKARVMDNEVCHIIVDETGTPLSGELAESGPTLCRTKMFRGLSQPAASSSGTGFSAYRLILPAGLTAVGLDSFYCSDPLALPSGVTDFTIGFEIESVVHNFNYRVIKVDISNLDTEMILSANGPLIYEQPITPSTLTITAQVVRSTFETLAERSVDVDILVTGLLSISEPVEHESGIHILAQTIEDGTMRLTFQDQNTGESNFVIITAEVDTDDTVMSRNNGVYESLDFQVTNGGKLVSVNGTYESLDA